MSQLSPCALPWIARVIRSCKTLDQVSHCRRWVRDLASRQQIAESDAKAIEVMADNIAGFVATAQDQTYEEPTVIPFGGADIASLPHVPALG